MADEWRVRGEWLGAAAFGCKGCYRIRCLSRDGSVLTRTELL